MLFPATLVSLLAAATWGAADFNGGRAARRAPVIPVAMLSQFAGCLFMVVLAVALRQPFLSARSLGFSILAGAGNALGITCLYRSLAEEKMGIGAPVAAVITAMLPVGVGIAGQGWPAPQKLAGFVLAITGIWLLARPSGPVAHSRGLRHAVLAGIGFSGFLVLIRMGGGTDQALWSLAVARGTPSLILLVIGSMVRTNWSSARPAAVFIVLAGVLDSTGGLLFTLAAHHARLDVATILASLYPASTVILARLVLKERLSRSQTTGMLAALAAVPLIAM
ncbi:MAG: DMT family transporter [Acidobacteria bacterium]|nr:DMT family transporter [Acidobacteriota bacterium]